MSEYERNLLQHMKYHGVKQWLLDGCKREDARTIKDAVQKVPEWRLIRRLARALAEEVE
jgi:hypothetical protein